MSELMITNRDAIASESAAQFFGLRAGVHPRAWRVGAKGNAVLPMPFVREDDARLAQRGLEEAGLDTLVKIQDHLRDNGHRSIERIMVESLNW